MDMIKDKIDFRFIIVMLILFVCKIDVSAQTTFHKCCHKPQEIIQLCKSDSQGNIYTFGREDPQFCFVTKFSSSGQPMWMKKFGFSNRMIIPEDFLILPNGNLAFLLTVYEGPCTNFVQMLVLGLDPNSDITFSRLFGDTISGGYFNVSMALFQNGFLICCNYANESTGPSQSLLIKFSSDFQILDAKSFETLSSSSSMIETKAGNLVLVPQGFNKFYCLDSTLTTGFTRLIHDYDNMLWILKLLNGEGNSIYAIGHANLEYPALVLKLDENLFPVWIKHFSKNPPSYVGMDFLDMHYLSDSTIMLFGYENIIQISEFFLHVTKEFNVLGGAIIDGIHDVMRTHAVSFDVMNNDDIIAVSQYYNSDISYIQPSFELIRTDTNFSGSCLLNPQPFHVNQSQTMINWEWGTTDTEPYTIDTQYDVLLPSYTDYYEVGPCDSTLVEVGELVKPLQMKVSPNPAYSTLNVDFNNLSQPHKIIITTIMGDIVIEKTFANEHETLDISSFVAGVYIIRDATGFQQPIKLIKINQ